VAVLLLALAVLLASCGGTSGGSEQAAATKDEPTGKDKTPRSAEATGGMDDMGGYGPRLQGYGLGHADEERQEPFDKSFIDEMIPHHQFAIDMAGIAHRKSDNPKSKVTFLCSTCNIPLGGILSVGRYL